MVSCNNSEKQSKEEKTCGYCENEEQVVNDAQEVPEVLDTENVLVEEVLDEKEILKKDLGEIKLEKKRLKDENSKLFNELDALKDRLSRTVAEYENYRKRTAKEKEGIYTDACMDVLKEVLPVLDNLERASAVQGTIEDLKTGVEITIKQFNDALQKLNVEEIPVDTGFDPNFHNAVMHVEDDALEKNSVVEVFEKGYKRGDKVLRHSMVKVAN